MGFFDRRCAITGLNLRCSRDVAFVLLEKAGDGWLPCALPIFGAYNGYGNVESIVPDVGGALLLLALTRCRTAGSLDLKFDGRNETAEPITALEHYCELVERGHVDDTDALLFEGRALAHCLVDGGVLAALMASAPMETGVETKLTDVVAQAFGSAGFAVEVFGAALDVPFRSRCRLGEALCGVIAVKRWLREHDIEWAPPAVGGQYSTRESLTFVDAALERFADEPILEDVLRARQIDLWDEEDDDKPD